MASYSHTYTKPGNEVIRFLNLLRALVNRDIRSRYRRSLLGPAWAILQPLLLMVVFTALRGVLDISSGDVPYVIFSYSALMPWTFFSNSVSRAAPSVLSNANIIKKIRVARELFPTVAIVTAGFDTAMAGVIMAGLMIYYAVPVGWNLLWLPVLLLLTALMALGVGMFLAAVGVYQRDFLQASGFALQLWLYATPIIYPLDKISGEWQTLYKFNPMVGLLEGFRAVLARGEAPDTELLLMALPGILIVLIIAWPLFRYTANYFSDVL
jgi:ABC-type polysaccharide/polyol phosphate export permease